MLFDQLFPPTHTHPSPPKKENKAKITAAAAENRE